MPTVKQLRYLCQQKGLTGYSKMRKAELMIYCNSGKKPVSKPLAQHIQCGETE